MTSVYEEYNVRKVINASGKMTILGGSKVSDKVTSACQQGAQNFFEVKDLLDKTGIYLANLLGVESTYIVNSASGGIAQSIAACICQDNLYDLYHLYAVDKKREIVIPKGHNVDYGTPIEVTVSMGGGILKEAGYANACTKEHVEACINQQTVALLYVKSHHCVQKGMLSIAEMVELKQKYHLPLIVDAAAEEELTKYVEMGADVVVYSGTKAFEGPTSGLLVGKKEFIDLVKIQSKGIGRVMKVGKENILGLVAAIEQYVSKVPLTLVQQKERLTTFHQRMNQLPGLEAKCVQDGAGRLIIRSELDFRKSQFAAKKVCELLKQGEIAIYTRDYRANEGIIEIDIRDVTEDELIVIANKIEEIMGEA